MNDRSRLIRAWFRAMRRYFTTRSAKRAHELRQLAETLAARIEQHDRPRLWWVER